MNSMSFWGRRKTQEEYMKLEIIAVTIFRKCNLLELISKVFKS